ncbi:hypothetical protein HU200_056039 [Digitaria exilis]|uniref:Uncharacterized protein n=1 Tax=Digitaria exilis TaxID=1010633 RepID=A0A835AHK3_9POAL|nr:hypothetical protein HU200_056039 [Digitaria exilis]
MTMSAAYKVSASASLSIGKVAFMIAIAAMTIADIVFSAKVKLAPKWSVYLSVPWSIYLCGSLLVLASYLLLISFHTDYVYSIFPVLFLIVAAFLHHKYKEKVNKDIPRGKENDDKTGKDDNSDDEEVEHFDGIFETSSNIVTGGSLITLFGGQYMVGVVSPLGFFFFFTVVLGIYLMTITTVRTGALTPHATYLEIMLKLQLVITIITAFFP